MTIGEILKSLRETKNVSQKEVAESIGVSDVIISLYEQGKKTPSTKTLKKISEYYGVSTDYLLGKTNDKYLSYTDVIKNIFLEHGYKGESEEELDKIRVILDRTLEIYKLTKEQQKRD